MGLVDRNGPGVREVERKLRAEGSEALAFEVDLSLSADAENTIEQASKHFGRIDTLVNNAASSVTRDFFEMTPEEWRRILDTNLTAYFLCARGAALEMRKQGGGSIVNIGSVHRTLSEPSSGAYAASKAAVSQLTRNLAIEFAPYDIVVNSISPSFIRTQMSVVDGVDETTTERFQNYYVNSGRIPLRRVGMPEEIARAVLFLSSRECGYLTGADLMVDGGLSITL